MAPGCDGFKNGNGCTADMSCVEVCVGMCVRLCVRLGVGDENERENENENESKNERERMFKAALEGVCGNITY